MGIQLPRTRHIFRIFLVISELKERVAIHLVNQRAMQAPLTSWTFPPSGQGQDRTVHAMKFYIESQISLKLPIVKGKELYTYLVTSVYPWEIRPLLV